MWVRVNGVKVQDKLALHPLDIQHVAFAKGQAASWKRAAAVYVKIAETCTNSPTIAEKKEGKVSENAPSLF